MLANLVGLLGDFDLAEEAAQEAFAEAAARWPREGEPRNPGAWLTTTARNRAFDRLRRDRTLARKAHLLEPPPATEDPDMAIPDERLELIFTCCHPALSTEAQVALTLRTVGGLSTDEIGRAFLVSGDTMKRRLSRAKHKIAVAGIPFKLPDDHLLPDRIDAVLAVVYLIYNRGYDGRGDLAAEAIRLGRLLATLMPDEAEVWALLSLMLLQDSRRDARVSDGRLMLLHEQDRALWDQAELGEGRTALERSLALGGRGAYMLQAAIAELHTRDEIDWLQVAALYAELGQITGSPVVELNRAVAIAELHGPGPALCMVETLDLAGYAYYHSTRAELLRRLGRFDEARFAYAAALDLSPSRPERLLLEERIDTLGTYPANG